MSHFGDHIDDRQAVDKETSWGKKGRMPQHSLTKAKGNCSIPAPGVCCQRLSQAWAGGCTSIGRALSTVHHPNARHQSLRAGLLERAVAHEDRTPFHRYCAYQRSLAAEPSALYEPLVVERVEEEVATTPAFAMGGVWVADEKASEQTVGAGCKDHGRMGKVEMERLGRFLAYVNDGLWCWIDGELSLPAAGFAPEMAKERARLGVPSEHRFTTKIGSADAFRRVPCRSGTPCFRHRRGFSSIRWCGAFDRCRVDAVVHGRYRRGHGLAPSRGGQGLLVYFCGLDCYGSATAKGIM